MRIWVDDLRPPPVSWKPYHHVWCKSSGEAIQQLERCHMFGATIEEISFDHDLGLNVLGDEDTARPVVNWMIEYGIHAENYSVHSANPVGAEWLMGTISRYLQSDR